MSSEQISAEKYANGRLPKGESYIILPALFSGVGSKKEPLDSYGGLIFNYKDTKGYMSKGTFAINDISVTMLHNNIMCHYVGLNQDAFQTDSRSYFPYYSVLNSTNTSSLDLYRPNEVYSSRLDYPEGIDIYSKFWKSWIEDRYNVDTKVVECDVNLNEYERDNLKLSDFFNNR